MGKRTDAGIDVSKAVLDVAVRRDERQLETARFPNDPAGHKSRTHFDRRLSRVWSKQTAETLIVRDDEERAARGVVASLPGEHRLLRRLVEEDMRKAGVDVDLLRLPED